MYEMLQNHRILGGSTKYTATGPNNSMTYNFIRKGRQGCQKGIASIQDLCARIPSSHETTIIYLPERSDELKPEDIETLSKALRIPQLFWTPLADEASSFFGCQESKGTTEGISSFDSYFRFLVKKPQKQDSSSFNEPYNEIKYDWHKLGVHVAWTTAQITVLFRGLPPSLETPLYDSLKKIDQDALLSDPFAFHGILLEELTVFYDSATWEWRNEVRKLEKNRPSVNNPMPNFAKTHEIARHAIHSSETLAVAIQTIEVLIEEHDLFTGFNDKSHPTNNQSQNTRRKLRCQLSLMRCLHLRSKALEDRLRNEINLAFNIVAQYNSHISVRIGDATRADSAAMKTIAVLGLVFLPGSFVCAVFSTSFFNFTPGSDSQSERWTVSEKFWVYWIVAIPVTAATIAFWIFFQKTTTTSTSTEEEKAH